jgi:hypothetical protein
VTVTAPSSAAPRLSRVRTFLFGGLALVWFGEMLFTGVPAFAETWTRFWKMYPPDNPDLTAALYITHAFEAPLKAGLLVLALFGLLSRNTSARTALFVSMSLVPPINIAFHFRAQGFPVSSMTIATVLSGILWVSFLLTSEPAQQVERSGPTGAWDAVRLVWCALSAGVLTIFALLFLLAPDTVLHWEFPCLSDVFNAHQGELASLRVSTLAAGSHLTALATATWFATARSRRNRTLRQAITFASIAYAGLVCLLPLRQIVSHAGWHCWTSPVLISFVPLLVGWVVVAAAGRTGEGLVTMKEAAGNVPKHA